MVVIWHVSNENKPGCLGYIGDEILQSYIGITTLDKDYIGLYKDPYDINTQYFMESKGTHPFFFRGSRDSPRVAKNPPAFHLDRWT